MKYFVTIGTRTVEVDVDGEAVRIDGQEIAARLEHLAGTPEVRLVVDGVPATIAVESSRDGTWRLLDRGAVREVSVEGERHRHIRLLAGAGKPVDRHITLKAPMPGLVLRIPVAVGDLVGAGTPLLALEAMKMENELKAAAPGRVLAVLVQVGSAVEKGQALLELGPADLTEPVVPG